MKAMHRKRLLRLADYLEMVPRKEFSLREWAYADVCGTTACALGHACMISEFQRAGLRLVPGKCNPQRLIPMYRHAAGWGVGQSFFDLDASEERYIFDRDEYPNHGTHTTPKQVAKRIRQLVKERMVTK